MAIKDLVREYYDFYNQIPPDQYNYIFHIPQNLDEIKAVVDYLGERKFKSFVELGSCNGGSLWLYSHLLCADDAQIYSVECAKRNDLSFVFDKMIEKGKNVTFINGHSQEVADTFTPTIDLLHIDAGHHYEAVKLDWDMWYPKVVPGGVILLHDTLASGHIGPPILKKELEEEGFNIKTFGDWHALGISVVIKP